MNKKIGVFLSLALVLSVLATAQRPGYKGEKKYGYSVPGQRPGMACRPQRPLYRFHDMSRNFRRHQATVPRKGHLRIRPRRTVIVRF